MKIVFDSNIWQKIVCPNEYHNDKEIENFFIIHENILQGKLHGFISETIFTIENIEKKNRKQFLSEYKPKITFTEIEKNGGINLSVKIESDENHLLKNNEYHTKYWEIASKLGFKLLRYPRNGGFKNEDLKPEYFLETSNEIREKLTNIGQEIENRDCGFAQIKKYAKNNKHWFDCIKNAPDSENKSIAKDYAEWADGDMVAVCYAYSNDYLCTLDLARNAGNTSIFSIENKKWLCEKYNIKIITPEQLVKMIV